jgi:hypothetical protein
LHVSPCTDAALFGRDLQNQTLVDPPVAALFRPIQGFEADIVNVSRYASEFRNEDDGVIGETLIVAESGKRYFLPDV